MSLLMLFAALALIASADVESDWDSKKTREVQARYGECVIKRHLATAQHFVLTPDLEKSAWRKDVNKIADGSCLLNAAKSAGGVQMTFPADTMRYALADALVRREFSTGPALSIKEATPLIQPTVDEAEYTPKPGKKYRKSELKELAEGRTKQAVIVFLANFGECVVRAEPSGSHKLLMAQPASAEEHAPFTALLPSFGLCLPAGQTLAFNKATLRGAIAMNYYRLAHSPRVAAAAGASK